MSDMARPSPGRGAAVLKEPDSEGARPSGTVARVVRSVGEDARGIVAPDAGLQRFRLDRFPPSAEVGRMVDRYWVGTWDLRGRPSHTQHVYAHPVVNVTFQDGGPGLVTGVTTAVGSRTLSGAGRVLGIMFRPAGFRPLLGRSLSTIRDVTLPWSAVVADAVADGMARAVAAAPDGEGMAAAADAALARQAAAWVPPDPQPWGRPAALVERARAALAQGYRKIKIKIKKMAQISRLKRNSVAAPPTPTTDHIMSMIRPFWAGSVQA